MLALRIGRAAIILVIAAAPVLAQDTPDTTGCFCPKRRASASASLVYGRPIGALKNNISSAPGYGGAFLFRLGRTGVVSLRADLAILQYGEEKKTVALSSTVGGRIQFKLLTTNNVLPFTIGPQLTWPSGRFRPYVNVGIGGQEFSTASHLEGLASGSSEFGNTTNVSNGAFVWGGGGGVYIPVWDELLNVAIDLGGQYVNGGKTKYLTEGGIQDLSNGQVQLNTLETDTHLFLFRLGVKVRYP